jgi:Lantibiotic biosynthesis dehydratase C-term
MSDWVSLHAHHGGDLDGLLVEAAAPALVGRDWFFLRYWEGGAHLRIRVAGPPDVAGTLRVALADWLRDHPAPPSMTAPAYAAAAQRLAAAEGRSEYEQELQPGGTVREVAYEPERDVFGSGGTLAAAERHFVESSALAVRVLQDGTPAGVRRGLALSAGLLTIAACEPDLPRLADRFRAAGDSMRPGVDGVPDGSSTATWLHESYVSAQQQLSARVQRAWQTAAADGTDDRLGAWWSSIRRLHGVLTDAGAAGHLAVGQVTSPYAWYLAQLEPSGRAVASVLLRCAHLFVNRLGVPVADEMHLTYLTARALADAGAPELRKAVAR